MVSVQSILDTDLYKLSMQEAVLQHFPTAQVEYKFINRKQTKISKECFNSIKESVQKLKNISLTDDERQYLEKECPFFTKEYLDYLSKYEFNPDKELIYDYDEHTQDLQIKIKGLWVRTILYEVPVLALISENYFDIVDTNWSPKGQRDCARDKAKVLLDHGCTFTEFGTRRRRSYATQVEVMKGLEDARNASRNEAQPNVGTFVGTSNVHLAQQFNLKPIGTIAHEWIMGVAALYGYKHANEKAMQLWSETYHGALSIMITDTFTTQAFFNEMRENPQLLKQWNGLRQDSGNPLDVLREFCSIYKELCIDYKTKSMIFSDALNVEKCLQIQEAAHSLGANVSYGIGTYLTNDFMEQDNKTISDPLNIVIKLSMINDKPCLKLSDDVKKLSGSNQLAHEIMTEIGINLESI